MVAAVRRRPVPRDGPRVDKPDDPAAAAVAAAEPSSPTPQRRGRVEVEVKVDAVIKQDPGALDEDDSHEVEDPRLAI